METYIQAQSVFRTRRFQVVQETQYCILKYIWISQIEKILSSIP